MHPFNRRHLLKGAAGIGLALPWLESMAQTATAPRRVIFVFTANGDQIARRFTTKTETGFVFDEFLAPLEPYRQNLLVMEGIHKYHNRLPDGERADGHEQGGSALAPWRSGAGSFPIGGTCDANGNNCQLIGYVKGPSVDKAIGDRVVADNPSVPQRHLNFRVGGNNNNIWNQSAHAGPEGTQAPIPPEVNPFTAYTRIFSGLDFTGQAALARRLAMKQSALDLVNAELNGLKPKLGVADRARLELHTESLRDIERGLMTPSGTEKESCGPLTLGAGFDHLNGANFDKVGQLFFKIIAMSFACDLTRSVNFNWSGNTDDRKYSAIGMTEGHHTLSHNSDTASFDKVRQIKKLLYQQTTQLFDALKALPEAGKSLWDHTLVVNWSELSQGDTHQFDNDLVVFAGGAHNYFRTGRYLNFASQGKRSFSNMLVCVWQYMGYSSVDSFGDPLLLPGGNGPLAGLT